MRKECDFRWKFVIFTDGGFVVGLRRKFWKTSISKPRRATQLKICELILLLSSTKLKINSVLALLTLEIEKSEVRKNRKFKRYFPFFWDSENQNFKMAYLETAKKNLVQIFFNVCKTMLESITAELEPWSKLILWGVGAFSEFREFWWNSTFFGWSLQTQKKYKFLTFSPGQKHNWL